MRPWVLLALTACSPSRDEPRQAPHHEEPRQSIDLTVQRGAVSIRGVEVARSGKNLELGYRIEGQADVAVPAEIMCRVHGYNLIYPTSATGKVAGPRLTATFRPDPFDDVPQVCEVTFTSGPDAIAHACFRDNVLADGSCPDDSFRSPKDEPGAQVLADVQIEHGKLDLGDDAAVVTAVITKIEPVAAGRRYAAQLSCADAAGPIVGEAGFAFVPLDRMAPGTSVYGPVPILIDRKPKALAACDLRIVSRATQGPPEERLHAAYCATTQAIRVGRCTPN